MDKEDERALFQRFKETYNISKYASPERTAQRMARDKTAARSKKQRARRALKTDTLTFRCTPKTKKLGHALAEALGVSMADAVAEAIAAHAKKHKVTISD